MISGKTRRSLGRLALLTLLPAAAWCAALEIDSLLPRLARPAPASTPFVEAHFSRLLARPLVVRGKLEYLGADTLARTVESPYHERTEVRAEAVTVEREGSKAQHFSLQHAPELRSLLGSFAALLSGDAAGLRREFDLDLTGDEDSWTLKLTPRDAHVRARIPSIVVSGRGDEPRCITTLQAHDNTTVMLMAHAAEKPLPATVDRAWLDQQCQ
jgi:hypothetical protein